MKVLSDKSYPETSIDIKAVIPVLEVVRGKGSL